MKEKEIKTYGELAEEYLRLTNAIVHGAAYLNVGLSNTASMQLKKLIETYGEENIECIRNKLEWIRHEAKQIEKCSNHIHSDYFPDERIGIIYLRIEELNKLKAELDKEIEFKNV